MNYPGTTSGNWQWRMQEGMLSTELQEWLADVNRKSERYNLS
jgi:4-alpha-glucanotransferase